MKTAIGIIGLGVMGTSISRNLARNGFSLSLYNRFVKGVEEDVAQKKINQYEELESALPFEDLKLFADSLTSPQKNITQPNSRRCGGSHYRSVAPLFNSWRFDN